jgi:prevent-host-death family protein
VSAREANQQFSRILRDVEAGVEILVTPRGRPVARIVPAQPSRECQLTPEQEAAPERTRQRLEKGWDLGKFAHDELYDEILARR